MSKPSIEEWISLLSELGISDEGLSHVHNPNVSIDGVIRMICSNYVTNNQLEQIIIHIIKHDPRPIEAFVDAISSFYPTMLDKLSEHDGHAKRYTYVVNCIEYSYDKEHYQHGILHGYKQYGPLILDKDYHYVYVENHDEITIYASNSEFLIELNCSLKEFLQFYLPMS